MVNLLQGASATFETGESATFETFFHDLIIIDNDLDSQKVIDEMTKVYQEKSLRDLQSIDMDHSYPVDFKVLLVCAILTDKLEEASKIAKSFHGNNIPVISLVTSGALESKVGVAGFLE